MAKSVAPFTDLEAVCFLALQADLPAEAACALQADFPAQQADLASLQAVLFLSPVLPSPACKAGVNAKAANVRQTINFFMAIILNTQLQGCFCDRLQHVRRQVKGSFKFSVTPQSWRAMWIENGWLRRPPPKPDRRFSRTGFPVRSSRWTIKYPG